MEERRSDTEETYGSQEPPGSVSNQNAEEAEPGHGDGEPREREQGGGGDRPDANQQRKPTDDPGSAKEGGQSTGHPQHAG